MMTDEAKDAGTAWGIAYVCFGLGLAVGGGSLWMAGILCLIGLAFAALRYST